MCRGALLVKLAALSVLGIGAGGSAAFAQPPESIELDFRASSFSYNGATGATEMIGVEVWQGDLSIEADTGTRTVEPASNRSQWRLEGDVKFRRGSVLITANVADFTARGEVLERFELRGGPTTFEDLEPQGGERTYGEAERVVYDAVEAVVGLLGEARIIVGAAEYTGCDLVYNVDTGSARSGDSDCERPFRVRFRTTEGGDGESQP